MKQIIIYLLSLDEETRVFVLGKMLDQQNGVQPEVASPDKCTGPGSTPNGHWALDSQGKCVWIPEIG